MSVSYLAAIVIMVRISNVKLVLEHKTEITDHNKQPMKELPPLVPDNMPTQCLISRQLLKVFRAQDLAHLKTITDIDGCLAEWHCVLLCDGDMAGPPEVCARARRACPLRTPPSPTRSPPGRWARAPSRRSSPSGCAGHGCARARTTARARVRPRVRACKSRAEGTGAVGW